MFRPVDRSLFSCSTSHRHTSYFEVQVMPQDTLSTKVSIKVSFQLRNVSCPCMQTCSSALEQTRRGSCNRSPSALSYNIPTELTLSTVACTGRGHQVMLRVFFFFATFGEALSQTAQAFIPGQLAREKNLKAAKTAARAAAALAGDAPLAEEVSIDPRLSPARTMMR